MITSITAKSLIGAAGLAASVSAMGHVPDIRARQTGAMGDGPMPDLPQLSDECQSAISGLIPLYSELPQIPTAVVMTVINAPEELSPCATPDFKGDDLSQWNSYTSAAYAWYSSNSETINQALSSCTELNQYTQAVPICTNSDAAPTKASNSSETVMETNSAASTDASTDAAKATDSTATDDNMSDHMGMSMTHGGSQPTGDASTSPTPAAAPRESGILAAAAVAAAGVLGFLL